MTYYSPGLRRAASRFGVDLPRESRFGIGFTSTAKVNVPGVSSMSSTAPAPTPTVAPAQKSTTTTRGTGYTAPVKSAAPLAAFKTVAKPVVLKIPLDMDATTALATADRLLGDPRIKNAKEIVGNTAEIAAALPHPAMLTKDSVAAQVQNAQAVIEAAAAIRDKTGAAPGQPAIPAAPASAGEAVYQLTEQDLAALTAVAPAHKGLWERFLNWLGLEFKVG